MPPILGALLCIPLPVNATACSIAATACYCTMKYLPPTLVLQPNNHLLGKNMPTVPLARKSLSIKAQIQKVRAS